MVTTKKLQETDFWALIEKANKQRKQEPLEYLIDALSQKTIEEIIEFDDLVHHFSQISYTSHLWCVAYIACGGCSDDSFDYFRAWLISAGKEVFEESLKEPDSLLKSLEKQRKIDEKPRNEDFLCVATDAYCQKTGLEQEDFHDLFDEKSTFDHTEYETQEMIFDWEDEDEESMKKICPKIFKALG